MIYDIRDSIRIHRKKLSNGLDVLVIPKINSQVVSLNIAYKVGSKDEFHHHTGFAHLFEHLMFEGTSNFPKGEFDRLCSTAGGTNNAYTTYDLTSYNMTLPANQLELGLLLESDRLFHSKVSDEALNNQLSVVIEEIKQTVENQPYGRWRELLADAAFDPECSYNWEVHGRISDLEKSTLDAADNFFKTFYKPENAALVIAGGIEVENAHKLVDKYFLNEGNNNHQIRRNKFTPQYLQKSVKRSYKDAVPFHATFLSFHTPGFLDDSSILSDLIANIAGDGRSSRIHNTLVYDKQIASSAGAFSDKREYSSLITFYAIANDHSITSDELAKELVSIIDTFSNEIISNDELVKARNQLATQLAYELQYNSGIADVAAQQTLFWDNPERMFTLLDKYYSVTDEELMHFSKKYLIPDSTIRIDVEPEI